MIVYALRHIATGKIMPQLKARGYSYWDPTLSHDDTLPPRIFVTEKSVQNARVAWGQGHHKVKTIPPSFEEPYAEDETVIEPVPGRTKELLEVIVFELQEVKRGVAVSAVPNPA